MSNTADTVIVLTTGKQDRGTRATLAFSWGCTALAMGQSVALYVTMDGTVWAMKGAAKSVQVGGFEPLASYIEQFVELGGQILVCAPCSEYYCSFDSMILEGGLVNEAKLAGLATIVGLTGPSTKVITL